jgi:hypothetical protein
MGAAYFIVLERKIDGVDSGMDGKSLSRHMESLNEAAHQIGVRPLSDFFSADPERLAEFMAGEGVDVGRLAQCRTRGKVFAFVTTSFSNHVRSLVQKYAFTAKRTGVKPPPRLPLGTACVPAARKAPVLRLDDPEIECQVGRDDERFRQAEFIVSAPECAELEALMGHEEDGGPGNGNPCETDEQPSKVVRKARRRLLQKCRAILMAVPDKPQR